MIIKMARERDRERSSERVNNTNNNFKNHFAKNVSSSRSTIYVNNLPDKLDIFGFKGIFNKIGSIAGAFIPVVQRGSRRFGFIRFKNQESVSKSIQKFNNKVIRESKISVFEAKRDMVIKQNKDPGKGGQEEHKKSDIFDCSGRSKNQEQRYRASRPNFFPSGFKFDISNNEAVSQKSCIKGQVNKERLKALLCSLVGETDLPVRVDFIWDKLKSENVRVVKVTALQKNKFILEFGNEDEADLALIGSQALADLFSNLKKWAWTDYSEKRFVWLEVFGVPPQGWNLENFRDIAMIWGNLVGFEKSLEDTSNLESLKLLILTSRMRRIEEEVILNLEDSPFKVWVEEIEEPILSQFFKAEEFDSKEFIMSEDEAEEEGEIREEVLSHLDGIDEIEKVDDSLEVSGEHAQYVDGVERVEDSLDFGGDVGSLVAKESKPPEEKNFKDDPEDNYESDECMFSLSSIPRVFSSAPNSLKDLESDEAESGTLISDVRPAVSLGAIAESSLVKADHLLEGVPVKNSHPEAQSPFCFGAVPVCQDKIKPKISSSNPKKTLNPGEKRKARSPRGRGSSSRRRVVKRRKRKLVSVPLAAEDLSSGSTQDEAVGKPKIVSSPPFGVVDLPEGPASESPDDSEESLRAQAIRQMHASNRLGLKIVPGEKNEEAYIQRAMRQIKERKRYIEQCISEENSVGSMDF